MLKKIACYALIFFSLNSICKGITGNFSINHLTKPAQEGSCWDIREKPDFLQGLLKQKYTYLGKGTQAFVFASEDGKHVLKVFKPLSPKYTFHLFGKAYNIRVSKLPFTQTLFGFFYPEETLKQRESDFQSYVNSFKFLKEETGLEYLHLAKTNNLNTQLQIFDKIGAIHSLDLDNTCFLIQKRTDMLYPTLASLLKEQKIKEAKQVIDSFVTLAFTLFKKEIVNPTTVEGNIGFAEEKAMLIDTGRVLRREDLQMESALSLDQIDKTVHHMKKWLKLKNPELSTYLEMKIDQEKAAFQSASTKGDLIYEI